MFFLNHLKIADIKARDLFDIRAPLNRALGKCEKQRCQVSAPAGAKKCGRDPSRGAQSLPTAASQPAIEA
jgi:hypothetical protein